MSVTYVGIDNEEVSKQWYVLLHDIRVLDGVHFNVNEGHRTLRRQAYFYALWKAGKGAIAAFPSPLAPHIRSGKPYHAVDFTNAEGVRRAAAKRGVTLTRTVRWPDGTVREEWHLEADPAQLKAYYERHKASVFSLGWRTLKTGVRGADVHRLQNLLKKIHLFPHKPGRLYGVRTRTAVKNFQKKHHLKADGVAGPVTIKAIKKAVRHDYNMA